tara:strand:+ start:6637 stop:7380 length:744 start_codon:yes stop_codon:yes gene_type:complete
MARISAKAAGLLVDEFDFSGVSNSMTLNFAEAPADVTAFADTDMTYVQAKPGFTFDVNGLWSTASPNYDGEMFTDLTATNRRVGIYPGGLSDGIFGYEGATNISASPRVSTIGDAIACNVTWQGASAPFRSTMLRYATDSSSANGTQYTLGTIANTNTIIGVLRLLEIGGSGNNTLDVKIQSDTSGFSSPTDQLTFTQLNQGSGATFETKTATGPAGSDNIWRVVVTIAGAGSRSFKIAVGFGYYVT